MKTNLNATIDATKLEKLNKFLYQEDFQKRLEEIRKIRFTITQQPSIKEIVIANEENNQGVLSVIEGSGRTSLDPYLGCEFAKESIVSGYDESKLQFLTLEGMASFISHAIVSYANDDLIPVTYLSFYFYSRSKDLSSNSKYFRITDEPETEEKRDYALDRNALLESYSLENSILLIDGPLIGGNLSSYTTTLVEKLEAQNVIPIFIVKNSDSNMVIDNVPALAGKYNSDLHWAYATLKEGERSSLFQYTDKVNKKNTKVFFYIKIFNDISPQRIEFHTSTFEKHLQVLPNIFNLIYYLYLLHGDRKNCQVRPIAIAEKYAREVLGLINPYSYLKSSGIIPTMNETRFGG